MKRASLFLLTLFVFQFPLQSKPVTSSSAPELSVPSAPAPEHASFPRISKNQVRPESTSTLNDPGDLELEPDPGSGGGGLTCVKNHNCTGGSICATGSCDPHSGKDCKYCTGDKCKGVRCS